ncbi:zinc-finger domain-containing protein [Neisseria sicca]|uniref:zinc-finger domain-containing protein n=1 Tax=Neisseria sicca TaxID=490 RepID=UPI00361790E6
MNANTETVIIYPKDLPLHCSGPNHETWNGHPCVFLPIQSDSDIECPYCGMRYHLEGHIPHHHY